MSRLTLLACWLALLLGKVARTQDDTTASRVAAMEEIANLALIPPTLNTSPLPEYDYDKLDYGMTWQHRGMATFPRPDRREYMIAERTRLKLLISQPVAREVAQLPTFSGPTPDTPRDVTLPLVDISQQPARQSVVARGTDTVYQGQCSPLGLSITRRRWDPWHAARTQGELGPHR